MSSSSPREVRLPSRRMILAWDSSLGRGRRMVHRWEMDGWEMCLLFCLLHCSVNITTAKSVLAQSDLSCNYSANDT